MKILRPIFTGFLVGVGFVLCVGMVGGLGVVFYPIAQQHGWIDQIKEWLPGRSHQFVKATPTENIVFDPAVRKPLPPPVDESALPEYRVRTVTEFLDAIQTINAAKSGGKVILEDGEYRIPRTIDITSDAVFIRSASGNPHFVRLFGGGMSTGIANMFRVSANDFHLEGVSLRGVKWHLIQLASESGKVNRPVIRNCILEDAGQQFIKVSYRLGAPNNYSSEGVVDRCYFRFTGGIGPNYYTGGIDAHAVRHWTITNNVFKDIASPGGHIAEHAIHLWNNSAFNRIEGNVVVDSDRGIGLGLGIPKDRNVVYSNYGGVVRNNFVFHSKNEHPFADTGIVLESSPNVQVENNWIYMEHDYPRAIEYRFKGTRDVVIRRNHTNKAITSRNGGEAKLIDNDDDLELVDFLAELNAHLKRIGMELEPKDYGMTR